MLKRALSMLNRSAGTYGQPVAPTSRGYGRRPRSAGYGGAPRTRGMGKSSPAGGVGDLLRLGRRFMR